MLTINPFAEISAYIPAAAMQAYIVVMVLFVIGGTVLDMLHKKSAQYFSRMQKKQKRTQSAMLAVAKKHHLLYRRSQAKY